MIKIVVDIQGADRSAQTLTGGVASAIESNPDLFVYLCGDKVVLDAALADTAFDRSRLEIVDAPQTVTNDDKPIAAVTGKKNSSLVQGLELCKSPDIGAFVTCGATGALFVGAMMTLGKLVKSPTLICALKKPNGAPLCIADCGANVDCRPERAADFARIGVAYLKASGMKEPRVALLSNGAEDAKGNKFTKEANEILRASGLNFAGNIEGTDVLGDRADVIVCDGFSGNILLKTIEGGAKGVIDQARALMKKADMNAESAAAAEAVLGEVYKQYDCTTQGGAMLLGFRTPIVKGHGAANAETVHNIITEAYALAKNGVVEKIQSEFNKN